MYVITVFDKKNKLINNEKFKVVLDRLSTESLTMLRFYKNEFIKKYKNKEVVITTKQKINKGWIEINI